MLRTFLNLLLLALSLGPASLPAWAQLVIVTGRGGEIPALSRTQAERLFLGRTSTLADNTPVTLIDLPPGADRDRFYLELTGKNPVQTRAYWSRQVFTGRALPPRQAESVEQLREWLRGDPRSIGYIPATQVDDQLRILLRVSD